MRKTKRKNIPIILNIAIVILAMFWTISDVRGASIYFPDDYFGENTTRVYSGNYSEIKFNQGGNSGFGLFFLGEGKDVTNGVTLKLKNSIACQKQLIGYYTTNFTDFGMFPLDEGTDNYVKHTTSLIGSSGVTFTGGFFYECNGKEKNEVFGYIKRTYGINGENTHEIRAGLNPDGNERANKSPLELIYSADPRQQERTLSGYISNGLMMGNTNNSTVTPMLFGDVGIGQTQAVGNVYTLDYNEFSSNSYTLYIKSLKGGINAIATFTGYDEENHIYTGTLINGTLSYENNNYGFHGYTGIVFSNTSHPKLAKVKSGYINIKIANSWSKKIHFMTSGASFGLQYSASTGQCTNGVTVKILPNTNTGSRQYKRGSSDSWKTGNNIKVFTGNREGQVYVKDKGVIYSGQELYIKLTKIDSVKPTLVITSTGFNGGHEGYECSTGQINGYLQDSGCGSGGISVIIGGNTVVQNGKSGDTIFFDTLLSNTTNNVTYTVRDSAGNETQGQITFTLQNEQLHIDDKEPNILLHKKPGSTNTYTASGNLISLIGARAGSCETVKIKSISCNQGQARTGINGGNGNRVTYQYTGNIQTLRCKFTITDGDTEQNVTGHFIKCEPGSQNPSCQLNFSIEFSDGGNFVYYGEREPNFDFGPNQRKFSSGSRVIAHIHIDSVNTISRYRYSCIGPETNYRECYNLEEWRPNGFNNVISQLIQRELNPHKCISGSPSRSDRRTRKGDNNGDDKNQYFEINLTGDHCIGSFSIPYQSKIQGPRQLRVEVEDTDGNTSIRTMTNTGMVIFSTEAPVITGGNEYIANQPKGQVSSTDTKGPNKTSFTATVTAQGATLLGGAEGDDRNAYQGIQSMINEIGDPDFLKLAPDPVKWLLSKYPN